MPQQSWRYWQRRLQYFFCCCMLCALCVGMVSTSYAEEEDLPIFDNAELEKRIARVDKDSKLSDTEKAETIELLELALKRNKAFAKQQKQAQEYTEALRKAPLEEAAFRKSTEEFTVTKLPANLSDKPLSELEAMLTQEEIALAALRKRSAEIDNQRKNEKSYDIPAALAKAREQAETGSVDSDKAAETQDAQTILATVTRHLQQARIDKLEQRLLSRSARMSLLEAEQKLLAKQTADTEKRIVSLRALVADHRQNEADQTLVDARQTLHALAAEPEVIVALAQRNVERAEELSKLVTSHDAIIRENEHADRSAKHLENKYKSLAEQLEIAHLDASPEFGAALRKQRDLLINTDETRRELKAHEKALTQSRLAQFQLDELQDPDAPGEPAALEEELNLDPNAAMTPERQIIIKELLNNRDAILNKLSEAYESYIDDLSSLTANRRELIDQSQKYANLLDQHLLWMPSANAMGLGTLSGLGTSLAWLLDPYVWEEVAATMVRRIKRFPGSALIAAGLAFLMLRRRPAMIAVLAGMKDRVGKVNRDHSSLTPLAMLSTLIFALPGPLAIVALARLMHDQGTFSGALSDALIDAALVLLILEFVRQCLRKNGLGELHFHWHQPTVQALKKHLPWFMAVFLPAILVNLLIEARGTAPIRDSLGRIAFVAATLVIATFAYRVLNPGRRLFLRGDIETAAQRWHVRYVLFPLVVLLPLFIAALSIYGYHYTAVKLDAYLLNSMLAALAVLLLYHLAQREFGMSERRLALEQVRAKRAAALAKSEDREAAEAAGEGVPTSVDLQEIDLQTVSQQTRVLLKTAAVVILGLLLWNVWSGFFPAFKSLDTIELWQIEELVDNAPFAVDITLWDLSLAVTTVVITFLAVSNIPGLLEVAVLSRMSFESGTNYAFTTMSRYIIVITGTIVALQLLGAQWSKLQWLIAALSLGLGFGLQEIVANFVSGIVILFERPIRIGDTVTVGGQSGTVSKIRIRATTIVDWDRREIIVPNKTFITEQLVNWTLTDPTTRAIICVGVGYDTDTDLVEKLLLEIAAADSRVLQDPPPAALFMDIADSTLNFELRVFVQSMTDKVLVSHSMRSRINHEFRAHNIEMAFPQRDLHFDAKPIEVQLVDAASQKSVKP